MKFFTLTNPDDDLLSTFCNNLSSKDMLVVYQYGTEFDLELHIYKDSDFDEETGEYNLVDIYTYQKDKVVDDAVGIPVDWSLMREFDRIKNYESFGRLE